MAAQASPLLPQPAALAGRRIVVADDDPAITWFLGDLLRARGATVEEALDGDAAYDRIVGGLPDVVLADVRMPGMAGKELARTCGDDPVLRDVAVVLLSWKEDWLARAIEEGVGAAGYLPKRATPEGALACVGRVLARRTHLESRLAGIATVRGLLEGVTPHRLLRTAAALRPNARVSIHDGACMHEVQLREGVPVSALRMTLDGAVVRGPKVLASMLALRGGRFVVSTERGLVEASLAGELDEQLAAAVTRMREGPELPEPAELPEPTATQSSLPPVVDEGTEPMMPGGATEPIQVSTLRLVMPRRPLQLLEQTAPMPPAPRNVRKARKATPRPAPSRPTLTGSLRAAMLLALVAAGLAVGMGMGDAPTARQSTTQSR